MRRSDVQFKAQADTALFEDGPIIEAAVIPKGWEVFPKDRLGYPFDGQPVYLTATGKDAHPAAWRTTRAYDAINCRWVHESYWARHNAGGQRIEFEPIGYKKMED